jgi:hypothetical protein
VWVPSSSEITVKEEGTHKGCPYDISIVSPNTYHAPYVFRFVRARYTSLERPNKTKWGVALLPLLPLWRVYPVAENIFILG